MEGNNVVNVSSFFLFEEATGDSDETNHNSKPTTANDNIGVAMDDDDAESCSWDLSDSHNQLDDDDGHDDVHDDHKERRKEEEDGDEEEDAEISSAYNQKWDEKRSIGISIDNHQKSSVSVDSTKDDFESLNEMEKNRLFWEACLAS